MAAESRVVREGIVAGLIGAAAVALLILVFDIASGAPFQRTEPVQVVHIARQGRHDGRRHLWVRRLEAPP